MEINPIVVGDCSGRIDRMVCYKMEDRCFARKRARRKKKEEAEKEEEQRVKEAKFRFMGKMLKRVKHVLRESLLERPKYLTGPNYFMQLNLPNCTAVDLEAKTVTFDYEHAVFADGSLKRPTVTATLTERTIAFEVAPMTGTGRDGKWPTDKVKVILLETALMEAYTVDLGTRGEGGSASETLDTDWSPESTVVYAYATDERGKMSSPSVYLTLE